MTYRYAPGWSYLDEYEDMGFTVKVVRGRFNPGKYFDSTQTTYIEITTSRPVTPGEIWTALSSAYTLGCQCEHDCCGHLSGGPDLVRKASKSRRHWTAILAYTPNY